MRWREQKQSKLQAIEDSKSDIQLGEPNTFLCYPAWIKDLRTGVETSNTPKRVGWRVERLY